MTHQPEIPASEGSAIPLPPPVMVALAVRQPWAWAIIHAGKDIENRSNPRLFSYAVGKRILVHASKTMTTDEYDQAGEFMSAMGVEVPLPSELAYAGVIGSVNVQAIVNQSQSRWFAGPWGLVLTDARPEPFRPARGQRGLFRLDAETLQG